MCIDIATEGEPTLNLSPEFVGATLEHARIVANATGAALQKLNIPISAASRLPRAILPEIGALEILRRFQTVWHENYPSDLPTFSLAQDDLLSRIREDPNGFRDLSSARLSLKVFRFFMNDLAWSSPTNGDTQFTIHGDDAFLDCLAQALWDTRNQVTK